MATKGELRNLLEKALPHLRHLHNEIRSEHAVSREHEATVVEEIAPGLETLIEAIELTLDPLPAAPVGRPKKEDAP